MPAHDDVLAAALQANVPVCLWGEPGAGRSTTVWTLASKLELPYVSATFGPSSIADDVSGDALWFHRVLGGEPGMLLLHLAGPLGPSVEQPLIDLLARRRAPGIVLPAEVRVILTGRRTDHLSVDRGELVGPAANALGLDFLPMAPEQWNRWKAMDRKELAWLDLTQQMPRSEMNEAQNSVAWFLGGKRDWPVAWKHVSRLLPLLSDFDDEARLLALSGLVGEQSAAAFLDHLQPSSDSGLALLDAQ